MIRASQPAMSARDVTRILFRHWWKGMLFFVVVVTTAVTGVLLMIAMALLMGFHPPSMRGEDVSHQATPRKLALVATTKAHWGVNWFLAVFLFGINVGQLCFFHDSSDSASRSRRSSGRMEVQ